jgi:hypothetical protein
MHAYEQSDPPPKRQRAITPKLLRGFYHLSGAGDPRTQDTLLAIIAELCIIGFFWAMRVCEFTQATGTRKTKTIVLSGITFRDSRKQIIPHQDPDLREKVMYASLCFVDQKNNEKYDVRTQERTSDPVMDPTVRLVSVVQRIYRTVPNAGPDTTIDSYTMNSSVYRVTMDDVRIRLRQACTALGGAASFGYDAHQIGNKSLRSGGAMALCLMKHAPEYVQLLGRWKSLAFMDYIRPQIIEWTVNLSSDMIHFDSFHDALDANTNTTTTRQGVSHPFIGSPDNDLLVPRLHLAH